VAHGRCLRHDQCTFLLSYRMIPRLRMGTDVQDVKPAKEIVDDMVKEAKQCLERGSKVLSGGTRAKL